MLVLATGASCTNIALDPTLKFLLFPGEAFCLSEELNLDEEALQMCFRNVKHVIPLAMPAIDHAVHEHTHHICRDWFHGLCKDDDKPPPPPMF